MNYKELEGLYLFSLNNEADIMKHNIVIPSKEDCQELSDKYVVDVSKTIQVLDDMKRVSFVLRAGNLTLFQNICDSSDEFNIEYIKEYNEF